MIMLMSNFLLFSYFEQYHNTKRIFLLYNDTFVYCFLLGYIFNGIEGNATPCLVKAIAAQRSTLTRLTERTEEKGRGVSINQSLEVVWPDNLAVFTQWAGVTFSFTPRFRTPPLVMVNWIVVNLDCKGDETYRCCFHFYSQWHNFYSWWWNLQALSCVYLCKLHHRL